MARVVVSAAIGLCGSAVSTDVPRVEAQQSTDASIDLVSQTRLVPGDENAVLTLRLAPTGLPDLSTRAGRTDAADDEVVVMALAPTDTRADVREAIVDAVSGAPATDLIDVVRVPFTRLGVRNGDVVVRVPIEMSTNNDDELLLPDASIYPLLVTVTSGDAPVASLHTFVERLPVGADAPDVSSGRLQVSIVGRVDGPPTLLPTSATRTDPATVAELSRVADVMAALSDVPITLALRPEVIDGLDRSREISDRTVLRELTAAVGARELIADTWVGLDPATMADDALSDLYVDELRRGEDLLTSQFPAATTVRSVSIAPTPPTGAGAELVRNLGVRSLLVLPGDQAVLDEGGALFADPLLTSELSLPSEGTLALNFVDATMAAALDDTSVSGAVQAQRIMADLVAWQREIASRGESLTGRTLVLTTPDGRLPELPVLQALVTELSADPRIDLQTFSTAALRTDPFVTNGVPFGVDPASDVGADDALSFTLDVADSEIGAVASMLPDRDPRVQRWRELMAIVPSTDLDDATRDAYVQTVIAEAAAIRGSVSGPPRTTFTLGGRSGDITLSIRNDADVPLRVIVRLTSAKLVFPDGPQSEVLAAGETTIVRVPVTARSNNTFPVTVELLTPDGLTPVIPPVVLTARVTALTGLGQLATGAGAIILATWWVRHWRRSRRRRLADESDPTHHPSAGRHARTTAADEP